jgi:hypothetical protein
MSQPNPVSPEKPSVFFSTKDITFKEKHCYYAPKRNASHILGVAQQYVHTHIIRVIES